MNLKPEIPLFDRNSKILFELKNYMIQVFFENLNSKVTGPDHDD